MPRSISTVAQTACISLLCVPVLVACNPTLNWREVRVQDSPLVALLPCKADASSRAVSLGGQEVRIHMHSCSTAGATFAVAQATLPLAQSSANPGALATAQTHWRKAALANITGPASGPTLKEMPIRIAGLDGPHNLVQTEGLRPGGGAVQFAGVWFAQGAQVFQAAIYADKLDHDMVEPFFSGLTLK